MTKRCKQLMNIYDLMVQKAGLLHWWPAETDFEVIVGAILTQSVAWKNVEKAILNLKNENLLGITQIIEVEDERLEKLIRSTLYYKQKAKKLKSFCLYVKENYQGELNSLLQKEIHTLREELLGLYGIGEETADSILLYAAHKPIFVVDAYTKRIFSRVGLFEAEGAYHEVQKFFMDNLIEDTQLFNEYHAQIVLVGKQYCTTKNAKCASCPLKEMCKSAIAKQMTKEVV